MTQHLKEEKYYLIQHYFQDNEYMQKIAEEAYNPIDVSNKEILAEWFKENNYHTEAEHWKRRAKLTANMRGI